ncbi:MAG: HAD-IIA family hydrolase [Candidatus Anstonellales archaeon]
MKIQTFSSFIFDLDGVVYRGSTPIKGAPQTIELLQKKKLDFFFLTNNATKTRYQYLRKLAKMGIHVKKNQIYTAAYAVAKYLSDNGFKRVHVVGEYGLKKEISNFNISLSAASKAEAVAAALDTNFTYKKMGDAANAVRKGAFFIAANLDPTNPVEDGFLPGSGAIVQSIATAAERKPDMVVGKPNTLLLDDILAENSLSRKDTALVGDRLDTDILLANKRNIFSICVLTGSTSKAEISRSRGLYKPKAVINSITEVLRFVK